MGVFRVFWNEAEKRSISVVFFGGGLSGWPGVVHGGAIATVLDEALGTVAVKSFPQKTGTIIPLVPRPIIVEGCIAVTDDDLQA